VGKPIKRVIKLERRSGMGGRRRRGGYLAAGLEEIFLQLCVRPMKNGSSGDQEQVAIARELVLMSPKEFSQTALGAIAMNGVTDSGRRSDYAGAWGCDRYRGIGLWPRPPPDREGTRINTVALGADSTNFILAAKVLLRAKTHGAAAS